MPEKFVNVGRRPVIPVATEETMEVGDSFVYPRSRRGIEKDQRLAAAWCAWRNRKGARRYENRTVLIDGEKIVRIWRTA